MEAHHGEFYFTNGAISSLVNPGNQDFGAVDNVI